MATLRLPSGVCVSTGNQSILNQYLNLGAVEVIEENTEVIEQEMEVKKRTPRKKKDNTLNN